MWRAANVGDVLHRIGRRVDEGDGVRPDRNNDDGAVVRREPHAVDQKLSSVERAEVRWQRIPESNDAEQLVVGRIGDRHRIGELLGRVDAVVVADGDVGR